MSNLLIGLIRTWVPIGVGVFLSWLVTLGVTFDPSTEAALIAGLTGLLGGLYYTAVRLLAEWKPSLGILLGVNEAPSYGSDS
jgi:uncharacterized membrane protein (DUF441 family)